MCVREIIEGVICLYDHNTLFHVVRNILDDLHKS